MDSGSLRGGKHFFLVMIVGVGKGKVGLGSLIIGGFIVDGSVFHGSLVSLFGVVGDGLDHPIDDGGYDTSNSFYLLWCQWRLLVGLLVLIVFSSGSMMGTETFGAVTKQKDA